MTDDAKSPLDLALDLLVYAPLGLALTAQEELPKLVEKGRERVTQQVTMARFIGEFTANQAGKMIGQRLQPRPAREGGPGMSAASPAGASDVAGTASSPAPAPTATATADRAPAPAPSTNGSAPVASAPSPEELAIPNYDSLSASQVVQRLAGLSAAELAAVAAYESATRHRKTILNRVAQLQSGA